MENVHFYGLKLIVVIDLDRSISKIQIELIKLV